MLKIGNVLDYFGVDDRFLNWPPDVFAVAMFLLQQSGAYTWAISESWPPVDPGGAATPEEQARRWVLDMRQVGAAWRAAAIELSDAPDQVVGWWRRLQESRDVAVARIRDNEAVCTALLQLSATADEASLGVGLPPSRDGYDVLGWIFLESTGSLSQRVDPEIVRVLPKCHTPQVGMTIRSLSHHLSLSSGNDVEPKWYMFKPHRTEPALNLLLVPWPKTLLPGDFRRADGPLKNMDSPAFGFFTYGSRRPVDPAYVNGLFEYAQTLVPSVDGVIFPEQSVTESEYERLKDLIVVNKKAFLMAGVGAPAGNGAFGSNYVRFDAAVRIDDDDHDERARVEPQHKHHRWCLTGPADRPVRTRSQPGSEDEVVGVHRYLKAQAGVRLARALVDLVCVDLRRPRPARPCVGARSFCRSELADRTLARWSSTGGSLARSLCDRAG